MTAKQLCDKYYSRLALEGMLKSLFCGLIVAFAVDTVVAFTLWDFGIKGVWWAIAAFVLVTAGMTPLFYFKKFKPDAKAIAKRFCEENARVLISKSSKKPWACLGT